MSTFIHLNESKLMEYYEKMMDEVFLQYHTYPSEIPSWAECGKNESLEQTEYGNMAATLAGQGGAHGAHGFRNVPRITHHSDPKYCNGLLRRR